jgi:hypothetical protein
MQLIYLQKLEYDTEEILTVAESLFGRRDQRQLMPLPVLTAEREDVEFDDLAA